MAFVLALDQGTTSSRAIVFDTESTIRGLAQKEFTQHFPQPGWVEHDAEEIWSTQLETARAAVKNAGITARDLAAIGVTNQRETTVLWDRRTGEPVHRAIVWQDRRTAEICSQLRGEKDCDELIRNQTGLVLDPYFSASKLIWLFNNVKGLRERADRGELAFGTIDSWLVWKLTGGRRHVTDYTNASRTLLFDIEKLHWSKEILQRLEIPESILPEVLPCTADFGTCKADLLGAEVPISGIAGDQQAALVGQACFAPGMAKNTYGTGAFLVFNTGDRIVRNREGMLATVAYAFRKNEAAYALEGSVFVAGAAVQWLRDGLGVIRKSTEIEQLASRVPDSGGVFFVPAFTGLGAPHWDPHARGTILGLTRGSTAAHLARAALEAMAYQSAEVVATIEGISGARIRELRVDGGAAANNLAMQFQADVIGVDVVRPAVIETTALGAAYLAGLQVGCWSGIDAISKAWKEERRFRSHSDDQQRRARMQQWMRAVERAKSWEQTHSLC